MLNTNKHISKVNFEKMKPESLCLNKKTTFFFTKSVFSQHTGKGFLSQAYKAKRLDSQVRPGFAR